MSDYPTERALIARIAAHESWARTPDRSARTAPARQGMTRRFEDQVDPDRILDPAERARRVASARSAHFTRLALRSAQARRRVAENTAAARRADDELAAADDVA